MKKRPHQDKNLQFEIESLEERQMMSGTSPLNSSNFEDVVVPEDQVTRGGFFRTINDSLSAFAAEQQTPVEEQVSAEEQTVDSGNEIVEAPSPDASNIRNNPFRQIANIDWAQVARDQGNANQPEVGETLADPTPTTTSRSANFNTSSTVHSESRSITISGLNGDLTLTFAFQPDYNQPDQLAEGLSSAIELAIRSHIAQGGAGDFVRNFDSNVEALEAYVSHSGGSEFAIDIYLYELRDHIDPILFEYTATLDGGIETVTNYSGSIPLPSVLQEGEVWAFDNNRVLRILNGNLNFGIDTGSGYEFYDVIDPAIRRNRRVASVRFEVVGLETAGGSSPLYVRLYAIYQNGRQETLIRKDYVSDPLSATRRHVLKITGSADGGELQLVRIGPGDNEVIVGSLQADHRLLATGENGKRLYADSDGNVQYFDGNGYESAELLGSHNGADIYQTASGNYFLYDSSLSLFRTPQELPNWLIFTTTDSDLLQIFDKQANYLASINLSTGELTEAAGATIASSVVLALPEGQRIIEIGGDYLAVDSSGSVVELGAEFPFVTEYLEFVLGFDVSLESDEQSLFYKDDTYIILQDSQFEFAEVVSSRPFAFSLLRTVDSENEFLFFTLGDLERPFIDSEHQLVFSNAGTGAVYFFDGQGNYQSNVNWNHFRDLAASFGQNLGLQERFAGYQVTSNGINFQFTDSSNNFTIPFPEGTIAPVLRPNDNLHLVIVDYATGLKLYDSSSPDTVENNAFTPALLEQAELDSLLPDIRAFYQSQRSFLNSDQVSDEIWSQFVNVAYLVSDLETHLNAVESQITAAGTGTDVFQFLNDHINVQTEEFIRAYLGSLVSSFLEYTGGFIPDWSGDRYLELAFGAAGYSELVSSDQWTTFLQSIAWIAYTNSNDQSRAALPDAESIDLSIFGEDVANNGLLRTQINLFGFLQMFFHDWEINEHQQIDTTIFNNSFDEIFASETTPATRNSNPNLNSVQSLATLNTFALNVQGPLQARNIMAGNQLRQRFVTRGQETRGLLRGQVSSTPQTASGAGSQALNQSGTSTPGSSASAAGTSAAVAGAGSGILAGASFDLALGLATIGVFGGGTAIISVDIATNYKSHGDTHEPSGDGGGADGGGTDTGDGGGADGGGDGDPGEGSGTDVGNPDHPAAENELVLPSPAHIASEISEHLEGDSPNLQAAIAEFELFQNRGVPKQILVEAVESLSNEHRSALYTEVLLAFPQEGDWNLYSLWWNGLEPSLLDELAVIDAAQNDANFEHPLEGFLIFSETSAEYDQARANLIADIPVDAAVWILSTWINHTDGQSSLGPALTLLHDSYSTRHDRLIKRLGRLDPQGLQSLFESLGTTAADLTLGGNLLDGLTTTQGVYQLQTLTGGNLNVAQLQDSGSVAGRYYAAASTEKQDALHNVVAAEGLIDTYTAAGTTESLRDNIKSLSTQQRFDLLVTNLATIVSEEFSQLTQEQRDDILDNAKNLLLDELNSQEIAAVFNLVVGPGEPTIPVPGDGVDEILQWFQYSGPDSAGRVMFELHLLRGGEEQPGYDFEADPWGLRDSLSTNGTTPEEALTKFISELSPESALHFLRGLDEGLAAEVLDQMIQAGEVEQATSLIRQIAESNPGKASRILAQVSYEAAGQIINTLHEQFFDTIIHDILSPLEAETVGRILSHVNPNNAVNIFNTATNGDDYDRIFTIQSALGNSPAANALIRTGLGGNPRSANDVNREAGLLSDEEIRQLDRVALIAFYNNAGNRIVAFGQGQSLNDGTDVLIARVHNPTGEGAPDILNEGYRRLVRVAAPDDTRTNFVAVHQNGDEVQGYLVQWDSENERFIAAYRPTIFEARLFNTSDNGQEDNPLRYHQALISRQHEDARQFLTRLSGSSNDGVLGPDVIRRQLPNGVTPNLSQFLRSDGESR
ncbi:MAG: hypothetical protein AAGA30_00680, partial [Planctomycetota bacterium]